MTKQEIISRLTHGCDGPITRFVLIARAMDTVKAGADPDDVANVLYESLIEHGFMESDDSEDDEPTRFYAREAVF